MIAPLTKATLYAVMLQAWRPQDLCSCSSYSMVGFLLCDR